MLLEIYTQRFQDFGEELQGTVQAGESIDLPAELAQDLISIELRSTTTDDAWRWDWEDAEKVFQKMH